jgi:hypothetical protein
MKTSALENGPVVIGGIGGSGTRVVAEILILFGCYMGSDLNSAKDNLTYTLLFKRPKWFIKNYSNEKRLTTGLRIMEKAMVTGEKLSFREKYFLSNAVDEMAKHGHNREKQGTGDWPVQRASFIKKPEKLNPERYLGWGWKEPNSHLLVPAMNRYFPDFRYIHTIRHGLDMAYSSNQQQLYNWGPMFGVDIPENEHEVPAASFRYWVEANRKIISFGEQLGDKKFLLVNFDRLCEDPVNGVNKIAEFLRVKPEEAMLQKAYQLPVTPKSAGRHKEHPESKFDSGDLEFLKKSGFDF